MSGTLEQYTHEGTVVDGTPDRVSVFREISTKIPINEFGLPEFLYRADLIPADFFELPFDNQTTVLRNAVIPLNMDEGFPSFEHRKPIWERMDHESATHFMWFEQYRNQPYEHALLAEKTNKNGHHASGLGDIRRLDSLKLPQMNGSTTQSGGSAGGIGEISELFVYYFWPHRCLAYDYFRIIEQEKQRERQILSTTNTHFLKASQLFDKLYDAILKEEGEDGILLLRDLDGQKAVNVLEKLVKIQRVSLGLNMNGGGPGQNGAGGARIGDGSAGTGAIVSPNELFRRVARGDSPATDDDAGGSGSSMINGARSRTTADLEGTNLEVLLNDPDTADLAQQLIIKIGQKRYEEENPARKGQEVRSLTNMEQFDPKNPNAHV